MIPPTLTTKSPLFKAGFCLLNIVEKQSKRNRNNSDPINFKAPLYTGLLFSGKKYS
jgi:hypothetical protein